MHKGAFRRLPRSAFEPLKITASLQCGVITDDYLPLDGVLYYHAMRERYGEQGVTFSGQMHPNAVAGVQLPLARIEEHGPMWYYAASFAQWQGPVTEGQDHWNKRIDISLVSLVDWKGRKERIDVASGPYKSYHMPVFYRHALAVEWYVMGHHDSIQALLNHATHLGKKTTQGWGAVLNWEISPLSEDWSVRKEGKLTRAIPAETGLLTGFRPSYWLPKNQAVCKLP